MFVNSYRTKSALKALYPNARVSVNRQRKGKQHCVIACEGSVTDMPANAAELNAMLSALGLPPANQVVLTTHERYRRNKRK